MSLCCVSRACVRQEHKRRRQHAPHAPCIPSASAPVLLARDLHVGLALALLVLERAVEQQDARVGDAAAHAPGDDDVLVEHDALEHLAVLDRAARDLLDLGVVLDVDLEAAAAEVGGDGLDRVERELRHQRAEAARVLGADARRHDAEHRGAVRGVDRERHRARDAQRVLERARVAAHDDGRVQVALEQRLGGLQQLAREDDHARRAVADLVVLRARELDHRLGGGVRDVDLAQDRVAVVRQHDAFFIYMG